MSAQDSLGFSCWQLCMLKNLRIGVFQCRVSGLCFPPRSGMECETAREGRARKKSTGNAQAAVLISKMELVSREGVLLSQLEQCPLFPSRSLSLCKEGPGAYHMGLRLAMVSTLEVLILAPSIAIGGSALRSQVGWKCFGHDGNLGYAVS